MRVQGGFISYGYFVCVRVVKWQFRSAGYIRWINAFQKKSETKRGKVGAYAMSGTMPCLSTDLTTHAVPHFMRASENGKAHGAEGAERFV